MKRACPKRAFNIHFHSYEMSRKGKPTQAEGKPNGLLEVRNKLLWSDCQKVQLFFDVYLPERERGEKRIFHPLTDSPHAWCNSQGWTRQEPAAQNSFQVSPVGSRDASTLLPSRIHTSSRQDQQLNPLCYNTRLCTLFLKGRNHSAIRSCDGCATL